MRDLIVESVRREVEYLLHKRRLPGRPEFFSGPADESPIPVSCQDEMALCNGAHQQNLFRTLDGLSRITGDPKYVESALAAIRALLDRFLDRNGLIYWGGHAAVDIRSDSVVYTAEKGLLHELKCCYPDYELMWRANPTATCRYIGAFWSSHVQDWGNLDFDRHGRYGADPGALWESAFAPGSPHFWGRGLTFVNAGSDLYYAGAMLSALSRDPRPLIWAERLAGRYVETRHAGVGISGYQFSRSATAWCNGPTARGDRVEYQIQPYLAPGREAFESMWFKPVPAVQRCLLALGNLFGEQSAAFRKWAVEEVTAWSRVAYRPDDNTFIPMLNDGYSLNGVVLQRDGYFGRRGDVLAGMPAGADSLWMYGMAFQHAEDPIVWQTARRIAAANGMGDIGEKTYAERRLNLKCDSADYRHVHAMIEFYNGTKSEDFVELAKVIGRNIVSGLREDAIRTDSPERLALLRLAAVLGGEPQSVRSPLA